MRIGNEPLATAAAGDVVVLLSGGLPAPAHVEIVERLVIADEGDILDLTLRDQHAVERVAV
jgi:hypothetical protein